MVLDLHIHTTISGDSIITPEVLIEQARKAGIDGICITEHGNEKSSLAKGLSKKYNFPVFGGMEASTELGDILVFGIDKYPRIISRASELKDFVETKGGVMIAAHPFRSKFYNSSIGRKLTLDEACQSKVLQLVHAMESVNGWSTEDEVDLCQRVSDKMNLCGTGGSDAHIPKQVGCCVTIFENSFSTVKELVEEIKKGRFKAEDRRTREQKGPINWFRTE